MAFSLGKVDQPPGELFSLFQAVLPHFASIASQRVTQYRDNADKRIPYVLFEADLILLGLRQPTIAASLSPESATEVRNACVEQITEMLGILESILRQGRASTEANSFYPLLEGIRAGTISCTDFELCSTEGNQYATVSKFSQCARELDRLCSNETPVPPSKLHKKQPSFEKTRAFARLLYECVSAKGQCQCNSCHGSMLYLQTHSHPDPSRAQLNFKMLFTKASASSYKWFEGIVNVTLPDPSMSTSVSSCQRDLDLSPKEQIAIRFTLTAASNRPPSRDIAIESICLALPASNMSILNLGIEGGKMVKRPPPRERASASTYDQALTLDEVLRMTPPLPLKLRRILAVILAHSALQLYETRWLPTTLTSTRVIFMQTDQGQVVRRPLIAARPAQKEDRAEETHDWQDLAHSSPFVLSLGIILLELWFGKHISELRDTADMPLDGTEDPNTDLFTAQRLWEQSEWDMSTRYRNAIGACVNWDVWDSEKASPEHLCRLLYDQVVSPIEDQLAEEFNADIEEIDNLLLSLSKSKDQRAISLAHQKRLLNGGKRSHPNGSIQSHPVKRRYTADQGRPSRSWSPCPESDDELSSQMDPDTYTVAIICALGLESNAVIGVMDEIYESLPEAARKDANAYTTGRIGKTSVVIVHLPGMGKLNSANSTMRLKSTFPKVGLCLVVGVCGGAPFNSRAKKEIVLGDVIISTGLKQIDFGRYYANGFVPKDDPEDNFGRPVDRLRSFLRMLSETSYYYDRISDETRTTLKTLLRSATGESLAYPGVHRDHLYESNYQHQCRAKSACETCNVTDGTVCQYALDTSCDNLGCEASRVVSRSRLANLDSSRPVVHFGRVACGDGVMKSAQDRDRFVERYQVIGFEMEAAGAWDAFPTVVIKGVCDYADSHKNKLWQGYSAAVAASCMKAVLTQWASRTPSVT